MGLESATFISDLNTSNPTSTDVLSQADDHLRLIKAAIKTTFPNINAAVTATPAAINAATSFDMPSGSIIVYAGSSAPTGWLFCDGSAISRSTYATLFGIISTSYGVGDGSSTFNLPDIRGRVVAGKEASASLLTSAVGGLNGNTLGNTGGAQGITLTSAQSGLPAHNHTLTMNAHTHTFTANPHTHTVTNALPIGASGIGAGTVTGGAPVTTSAATVTGSNSTVTTTGTIANNSAANASSAHANVQPTIILNYCIKT
tara:strand:- start:198 stop:971 length:774 start_codon:yes stop_codon:yes gene_type:complete